MQVISEKEIAQPQASREDSKDSKRPQSRWAKLKHSLTSIYQISMEEVILACQSQNRKTENGKIGVGGFAGAPSRVALGGSVFGGFAGATYTVALRGHILGGMAGAT